VLERKISNWTGPKGLRVASQAGFQPKYSSIDHLVTLRAIIKSAQRKDNKVFFCLINSRKSLIQCLMKSRGGETRSTFRIKFEEKLHRDFMKKSWVNQISLFIRMNMEL
jgi:hypothetical protein